MGILMLAGVSYAGRAHFIRGRVSTHNYYTQNNYFDKTKQCVVKVGMGTTKVRIVDIDRSGNPLNNGWLLFTGVLSDGESTLVKCTYGHVTIHYQIKFDYRTYVMTDQYCNNNTITIP